MTKITTLFMMLAISLVGFSQELVTNGDFESEPDGSWYGNSFNRVDDGSGSNFVNEANVLNPGNPWDANLSQEIELISGKTYVLSFDAYTDATTSSRSMTVGLGQTDAPFSSLTESPTLTNSPQTFTYTFTIEYGDEVSDRVIFDMGAQTGFVFIDNVSVVETESVTDPSPEPMTAAPTPPARPADDVISLYSDAYSNIAISEWSTGWDNADNEEVQIEENNTRKVTFTDPGGFLGVELTEYTDFSEMTYFHMDYWVADDPVTEGAILTPKFSNHAAQDGETNAIEYVNPVTTSGEWVSLDIEISAFTDAGTGSVDISSVKQFILSTANLIDVAYLDNIYFHKNTLSNNSFTTAEFKAYPNPSSDNWTIDVGSNTIKSIQVYDLTGKMVLETAGNNQSKVQINASNLNRGVYLANIVSDGNSKSIKLIKK